MFCIEKLKKRAIEFCGLLEKPEHGSGFYFAKHHIVAKTELTEKWPNWSSRSGGDRSQIRKHPVSIYRGYIYIQGVPKKIVHKKTKGHRVKPALGAYSTRNSKMFSL